LTAARASMADAAALTAMMDVNMLPDSSAADAAALALAAVAAMAVALAMAGGEDPVWAVGGLGGGGRGGGARGRTVGTRPPMPTCRSKKGVR
jgi:hypothetical protein